MLIEWRRFDGGTLHGFEAVVNGYAMDFHDHLTKEEYARRLRELADYLVYKPEVKNDKLP